MRRGRPFVLAIIVAATVCSVGAVGRAAPSEADLQLARERFVDARKLEDAGRWSDALTLFQRVAEVKMTPQVRFHVALCMENVGMWTQALDGYTQAVNEAGTAAPDVLKEATEHLHKLEADIPTVSLVVLGAAPQDELSLDRRRMVIDDHPLPIRADPGAHIAEVRRGGVLVAHEVFTLAAKETRRVEVRVGAPIVDPNATDKPVDPNKTDKPVDKPVDKPADPVKTDKPADKPADKPVDPPAQVGPVAPRVEPRDDGRTQRIVGWTVVGIGAAAAAGAGVFVGLRAGAMNRLQMGCPTLMQCDKSVSSIVSEGKLDATMVNVLGAAAIVGAAAGTALLLTAPKPPPPPTAGAISVSLRPTVGGVSLEGTF